ncbi:MAG: carbohydrate-binding protein [Lachnospiraceae bacterium]|nr:carbohydrate-binding protein [Lachnospiraceae bacterium]
MANLSLTIKNELGDILAASEGSGYVNLVYRKEYSKGDTIVFGTDEINRFYVVQFDDAMGENYVYITKNEFEFKVPFDDRKTAYSPKAFYGKMHLLSVRLATEEEIGAYKNLSYNIYDEHGDTGCYPHATANVETRNEPSFFARSVIDGVRENTDHGIWPYCSWGIDRRDDAEIELHFGRRIRTNKMVLVIRADFPHDSWWDEARLSFSDGTEMTVKLEKTKDPQVVTFDWKEIDSVKLDRLIKNAEDPSPFPALSQWEVYGFEV